MEKDFRFAQRKGRAIQVMYKGDYKWISTGCYTMAEAEAWAIAHLHTIRKDLSLKEYASGFYTKADPRGYRLRTEQRGHHYQDVYYKMRQSLLDRYILPVHGSFLLKDITPRMIESLVFAIQDRSNDLKNKVLYAYSTVLQSAKEELLIQSNPAADLKPFAADYTSREVFDEYDLAKMFPEDNNRLLWVWGSYWWASYFSILHETGWRPSEVSALRKSNVYPDKLAIYTNQSVDTKTRQVKDSIKTSGKGFNYKIGFISQRTMNMLMKQRTEGDHIFCRDGKFISPDIANKHLKGVCTRLTIPYKSQYSFRHTFDSELFGAVSDEFRKMLMGHSGKSNYDYLHLKPQEAIERAEKLKKL